MTFEKNKKGVLKLIKKVKIKVKVENNRNPIVAVFFSDNRVITHCIILLKYVLTSQKNCNLSENVFL